LHKHCLDYPPPKKERLPKKPANLTALWENVAPQQSENSLTQLSACLCYSQCTLHCFSMPRLAKPTISLLCKMEMLAPLFSMSYFRAPHSKCWAGLGKIGQSETRAAPSSASKQTMHAVLSVFPDAPCMDLFTVGV